MRLQSCPRATSPPCPGLFVIGSLAGFPLIKQAMNQGYEVVEHLVGSHVKPADHDILAGIFKRIRNGQDVDGTIRRIHATVRVFRDGERARSTRASPG